MAVIRELLTIYNFDVNSEEVEKADKALSDLVDLAKVATGFFAIGTTALVGLTDKTGEHAREVLRQADALGMSAEKFQEYDFLFKRFGADTNDVADAVATVTDRAVDASQGMESMADDFALIGIGVDELRGKNPDQLFDLFVEGMANTEDASKRTAAGARILGDDLNRKVGPAFAASADELDRLRRMAIESGSVLSNMALKDLAGFKDSTDDVLTVVKGLGRTVLADVAPALTEMVQMARDWMLANREVIQTNIVAFLKTFVSWVRVGVDFTRELADVVIRAVDRFGGLGRVLKWVGVLFATLALAKTIALFQAAIPLVISLTQVILGMGTAAQIAQIKTLLLPYALAAIIAVLALLIQDLDKFFDGQDSAIGELVEKYPLLGDVIYGLRDAWLAVDNAFTNFFNQIPGAFENFGQAMENFQERVFAWGFGIVDWWNDLVAEMKFAWGEFLDDLFGIVDTTNNIEAQVKDAFNRLIEWIGEMMPKAASIAIDAIKSIPGGEFMLNAASDGMMVTERLISASPVGTLAQGVSQAYSDNSANYFNIVSTNPTATAELVRTKITQDRRRRRSVSESNEVF